MPKRSLLALAFAALAWTTLPASAQTPVDTLGRIKAAKAINVAFAGDSIPYAFVGKDAAPTGYSIDLCKKVITGIGRAVGEPNLKVNWKVGTTAERLAMVAGGKADLECGNTTPTIARMKTVDFSNLVFIDAGYATYDVYRECAAHGWTALMGDKRATFTHKVKGRKSVEISARTSSRSAATYIGRPPSGCLRRAKPIAISTRRRYSASSRCSTIRSPTMSTGCPVERRSPCAS